MVSALAEHPILFSSPMVRAILEGRKTQTRRIVSVRNSLVDGRGIGKRGYVGDPDFWDHLDFDQAWVDRGPSPAGNPGPYLKVPYPPDESVHRIYARVAPGDFLWARETWRQGEGGSVYYRADEEFNTGAGWHPSIFMPKAFCRLRLRVENVRVERLQEIRCGDIRREGIGCPVHDFASGFCSSECPDLRRNFADLWDAINGKRAPWEANPWVWVVTFSRMEEP